MNTALVPSLGQTAQLINNSITPKVITDGLWGMGVSGLKTLKDTFTAVAPKLLTANNTKFWGLGTKGAGLALAAYSGISALTKLYNASKDLAGSPAYDTASGSILGASLDTVAAGAALGLGFGKFNAVPALLAYAASGLFTEYENLATGRSKLYNIPSLGFLLKYQANEGAWMAQGTPKLQESYDFFINLDNKIREKMGFDGYLLRPLVRDEWQKLHDTQNNVLETVNKANSFSETLNNSRIHA